MSLGSESRTRIVYKVTGASKLLDVADFGPAKSQSNQVFEPQARALGLVCLFGLIGGLTTNLV
jgi:hypothetical protein